MKKFIKMTACVMLMVFMASVVYASPYTGGGPRSFEEYYPTNYSTWCTMGNPNTNINLSQVTYTDGSPDYYSDIGGKPARMLDGSDSSKYYLYLNLNDSFAQRSKTWIEHPRVWVDIWYYDDGAAGDTFFVQYDSGTDAYKNAVTVTKTGTNRWKNCNLSFTDHNFNNRENGGSDLRIGCTTSGKHVYINQVVVRIPEQAYTASSILGSSNIEDKVAWVNYSVDGQAPAASGYSQSGRYMNRSSSSTYYMYFDLQDCFAWTAAAKRNLDIMVEYYDDFAGDLFTLQYSSTSGGSYKNSETVTGTNSGTWKFYQFHLKDANFNNSQNGGADFRFYCNRTSGNMVFHRVNVYVTPGENIAPYITNFSGTSFNSGTDRIVYTSLFNWYDSYSGLHTYYAEGTSMFTHNPLDTEKDTYSTFEPAWWKRELQDMIDAKINVAGICYWGAEQEMWKWSSKGLDALVTALDQLVSEGKTPPKIALFYDTSCLRVDYPGWAGWGADIPGVGDKVLSLTTQHDFARFYVKIKDFYSKIPPQYWARVDNKVMCVLYSQSNQRPIDFDNIFSSANTKFQNDFGGLQLFLAPETQWGYSADMEYDVHDYWGAANNIIGFGGIDGAVGGVGSEVDTSGAQCNSGGRVLKIDGKNGERFTRQLKGVLYAGRKIISYCDWNEIHEGSDLAESEEHGSLYKDISDDLLTNLDTYVYDAQGTAYKEAIGGQVCSRSTDGAYVWWELDQTLPVGTYKVFVRAHGYNKNFSLYQVNNDTSQNLRIINTTINSNDTSNYTLQDYYMGNIEYDGSYNLRLSDYSSAGMYVDSLYLVPAYEGYKYLDMGGTSDTRAVGGEAAYRSTAGPYVWWTLDKSIYSYEYRVYIRAKGSGSYTLYQVNNDTGATLKTIPVTLNDANNYKEYFVGLIQFDGSYNLRLADYSSAGLYVDMIYLQPSLTNFPQSGLAFWGNYQDDPTDVKAIEGKAKAGDASGNYLWSECERRLLPNEYNVYGRLKGKVNHNFILTNVEAGTNIYNYPFTSTGNGQYATNFAGNFDYKGNHNVRVSDFGATGGYVDFYTLIAKKDDICPYLDLGGTVDSNPALFGGEVQTLSSPGSYVWWVLNKTLYPGKYKVFMTLKGTGTVNAYQINNDTGSTIKLQSVPVNTPTGVYQDIYLMDIDYDGSYNLRLSDYSTAGLYVDMIYAVRVP